jgi:predicted aspartyl protease
MATVPLRIEDASIILEAVVDGQPCEFVLDTGDAIGPTFNSSDAQRLRLPQGAPEGVSGAGGASSVTATTATIALGDALFPDEQSAVDPDLQGPSLLGLPFFLAKGKALVLAWGQGELMLI